MNKIGIIIAREFNERVRKKSFIITTILMPLLMLGLMAAPTLMMVFAKGEQKTLLVIDESGVVAPELEGNDEVVFENFTGTLDEARQNEEVFGTLWIGKDVVEKPSSVRLYTNSSSSMSLEEAIAAQIEDVVEAKRLEMYNIEGEPIQACPHPYMQFFLRVPHEVREGDILRAGDGEK
jgi:ABC-2 type transport system permease protein